MKRGAVLRVLGLFLVSLGVLGYLNAEPVGATYTLGFGSVLALCWGQLFGWHLRSTIGFALFGSALIASALEFALVGLFCALILAWFCALLWLMLRAAFGVIEYFLEMFGLPREREDNPDEPEEQLPRHPHSFWVWLPLTLIPIVELESALRPCDPTVCHESRVLLAQRQWVVWDALLFYDDVECEAPWVLRCGLPLPLRTSGPLAPGELQSCWYRKAFKKGEVSVIKRGHAVVPGEHLGFDVVRQELGFERSFLLTSGGFDLRPTTEGGTELTIETRYQARLQPRWVWQPVERYLLSCLHAHLLQGLQNRIDDKPLHAYHPGRGR